MKGMRGLGTSTFTWRAAGLGGLLAMALAAAGCPADDTGPSGLVVPPGGDKDTVENEDGAAPDGSVQPDVVEKDTGGGTPDAAGDVGGGGADAADVAGDAGGGGADAADAAGDTAGGDDVVAAECTTAADCAGKVGALTACDAAACVDGACVKQTTPAPTCCLAAADCDDGNDCTTDSCPSNGGVCAHESDPNCCVDQSIYLDASFEGGGAQGFTVVDSDSVSAVTWSVTSARAYDGQSSFYFGNASCPSYYGGQVDASCNPVDVLQGDNQLVAGALRSPELTLPAGGVYYASWHLWSETEAIGDPSAPKCGAGAPLECYDANFESFVDALTVYVVDGASKTVLWNSAELNKKFEVPNAEPVFLKTTEGDFRAFAADLSPWAGKTVQLEFAFVGSETFIQSFYANGKMPEGVYVDDIVIRSGCGYKACSKDGDCKSTASCILDVCAAFTNSDAGVCLGDADLQCQACPGGTAAECDDGDDCTTDSCKSGECSYATVAGCCEPVLFINQGFESPNLPVEWAATGTGAATWHASKKSPKSGSWNLWFGNETSGTYEDPGKTPKGSVTSKAFTVPTDAAAVVASFELLLSTEWDAGSEKPDYADAVWYDLLYLEVVDAATGVVQPGPATSISGYLWDSISIGGTTGNPGAPVYEPIAVLLDDYKGKTVRLRFTFDAGDGSTNGYGGAHIDNLVVQTACDSKVCSKASDCGAAPDSCTEVSCVSGLCVQTPTSPDCCSADAQCDDGNPCTTDSCDANLCVSVDNGDAGCCFAATNNLEDFEGDAGSWSFFNEGAVGWGFLSGEDTAHGGAGALYFGNPATLTYEDGANAAQGVAYSPSMTIPSGGLAVLSFWLKLSTEFDPTTENPDPWFDLFPLDRLTISAVADGGSPVVVWESSAIKGTTKGEWKNIQASLASLAGQTVTFKFEFDSLDGSSNDHLGALIDDLSVSVSCGVGPDCFNSSDCADDGDPCTAAECTAGKCTTIPIVSGECCVPTTKQSDNFDGGVQGSLGTFKVDGYICESGAAKAQCNATAGPNVKWHVSAAQNHSAPFALRLGSSSTGTYDDGGKRVLGVATSSKFTLEEGVGGTLDLWTWVDVEPYAAAVPDIDRYEISVVDDNGAETVVWDKSALGGEGGDYGTWVHVQVSLDEFAGKPLAVRLTFDSDDGTQNSGAGIFVDDVKIIQLCPAVP